jgi:nucleoid DNA-binding protein
MAEKKPMTKSEIVAGIAETTGLAKKQVSAVLEAMAGQIAKSLGRNGPGSYTVPGLMKLIVVRKPATKARKGINPFTGEETMFKAKPARNIVKIRPMKSLKDMV